MFNIGPLEMVVLAIIGLVIIGPDKLPALAKDAANFLKTLRDLATTSRKQLREELGPEFADIDFRNLNPRTAVTRAVFGDEFDPNRLNPRNAVRNAVFGEDDEWREELRNDVRKSDPRQVVRDARESLYGDEPSEHAAGANGSRNGASSTSPSMKKDAAPSMSKDAAPSMTKPVSRAVTPNGAANGSAANGNGARPRPRPTPGATTPYDADAT